MSHRSVSACLALALALGMPTPAAGLTTVTGDVGGVTDPVFLAVFPFFSTPCPVGGFSADCLVFAGNTAAGLIQLDGGSSATVGGLLLGAQTGGDGTLVVEGAGSQLTLAGDDGDADVAGLWAGGSGAVASLQVSAGGALLLESGPHASGDQGNLLILGSEEGGSATATVSGAGSSVEVLDTGADDTSAGISVGFEGTGSLSVESGALVRVDTGSSAGGGGIAVGGNRLLAGTHGTGALTVSGAGSLVEILGATSGIDVGARGPGSLSIGAGAVVDANAGITVGHREDAPGDAVVDGAGSLLTGGGFLVGDRPGATGSLQVTGGAAATFTDGGAVGVAPAEGGLPAASGSVLVDGAGSVLDAGGALLVGRQLDGLSDGGSGEVSVRNGGEVVASPLILGSDGALTGDGSVEGPVSNAGGRIEPGLSAGTLTMTGDFVMTAGLLLVEVEGAGAGEADLLEVLGSASLTGGEVRFLVDPGVDAGEGLEVDFLSSSGAPGFSDVDATAFQDGAPLAVEVAATGSGLEATLLPEPAASLLLLAVGGALGALRRSRAAAGG